MSTEDKMRDLVTEAMRNARENGYHMQSSFTADEVEGVCVDMMDMDADVSEQSGGDVETVRPHVTAFLRRTGQY